MTLTKLLMDILVSHGAPLLVRKVKILCKERDFLSDEQQEKLQQICELPQAYDTDLARRCFTPDNLNVGVPGAMFF